MKEITVGVIDCIDQLMTIGTINPIRFGFRKEITFNEVPTKNKCSNGNV